MDPLGLFGRPNRDADPALHLLMESRDWSLCCAIRQIKFHEMHFCARNNVIYSSPISSSLARWPRKSSRPASDRVRSRRGSTASIASVSSVGSVGGSLDVPSLRGRHVVREVSQNAISTLLQPPIVRTGLVPHTMASAAAAGFKQPTARDIPPVTLTNNQYRYDDRGNLVEETVTTVPLQRSAGARSAVLATTLTGTSAAVGRC